MFSTSQQAKVYFTSLLFMFSSDKPIVIVEGTSDHMALRNVFKASIVPIYDPYSGVKPGFEVTNNKKLVIEMARWLKHEKKPKHNAFIALIDADYDRIDSLLGEEQTHSSREKEYEEIHVFTTDWHDLDVHVFWATIEEFIHTRMKSTDFRSFAKSLHKRIDWKQTLKEVLLETGLQIGLVRLSLHRCFVSQSIIGKRLTDTKFIDTKLNVHVDEAIQKAIEGTDRDYSEVRSKFDELSGNRGVSDFSDLDICLNVTNGHKILRIIGLCIIGRQGTAPGTMKWAEKSVPIIMRKMYSIEHFKKLKLYQRLSSFRNILFDDLPA